jgi:hypothetical protein
VKVEAEWPIDSVQGEKCVGGAIFDSGAAFVFLWFNAQAVVAVGVESNLPAISRSGTAKAPESRLRGIPIHLCQALGYQGDLLSPNQARDIIR